MKLGFISCGPTFPTGELPTEPGSGESFGLPGSYWSPTTCPCLVLSLFYTCRAASLISKLSQCFMVQGLKIMGSKKNISPSWYLYYSNGSQIPLCHAFRYRNLVSGPQSWLTTTGCKGGWLLPFSYMASNGFLGLLFGVSTGTSNWP